MIADYEAARADADLRVSFEQMSLTERLNRFKNARDEHKAMLGTVLDDESLTGPAAELVAQQEHRPEGGRDVLVELRKIKTPLNFS